MILVTGGTGFVGRNVVEQLLALGYHVRLLVREPKRAHSFAGNPQIEIVQGDVLKPETLPPTLKNVQAVIHLVGILVETRSVSYQQAHVDATRNLLAAAKQAGVTRWLHMSAAGTRPHAQSGYHLTKWQAEELVRSSGLDWTIFRPSLIYGYDERDRLLNQLCRALSWPSAFLLCYSFPLLDGGRPLVQPVSVREVARCFAHGLACAASLGRTLDAVGPVPLSWREMVSKIAASLGRKTIYEEVPLFLIMRKWLWIFVALIPLAILVALSMDKLSLDKAEIGAGIWAVLALLAYNWRETILFNVPGDPLRILADSLDTFLPQGFRFGGLLKMAGEDNVGDPSPASKLFGYQPESFDAGLAELRQPKAGP